MNNVIYKKDDIPNNLLQYFERAEIGLEETPEEFIRKLTDVFMEVHRVLKPEGTLWLNIGDSYNGSGGCHKKDGKNRFSRKE